MALRRLALGSALFLSLLMFPSINNDVLAHHLSSADVLSPEQVSRRGLTNAIERAKNYFLHTTGSGLTYRIHLPRGRFAIVPRPNEVVGERTGLIDFGNFDPGAGNKLIISGMGMYQTTLVFPVANTNLSGRGASRIQWEKIHFTKDRLKVSQGKVVSVYPNLVVELERGFPSLQPFPYGIYDGSKDHGRKIRRYVMAADPNNPGAKIPSYSRFADNRPGGPKWKYARKEFPGIPQNRRWIIILSEPGDKALFRTNDLLGIKSKHGGQAYQFIGGSHLSFVEVQWTHETRGVFRGVQNVTVRNSRAGPDPWLDRHFTNVLQADGLRSPRTGVVSYLASSAGGPQVGSPPDNPINWSLLGKKPGEGVLARSGGDNHRIENNSFVRLGDDPIGLFNVERNVIVRGNAVIEGPARGILNFNVCGNYDPYFYNHVAITGNYFRNTWLKNLGFYPGALLRAWTPDQLRNWCANWRRNMGG